MSKCVIYYFLTTKACYIYGKFIIFMRHVDMQPHVQSPFHFTVLPTLLHSWCKTEKQVKYRGQIIRHAEGRVRLTVDLFLGLFTLENIRNYTFPV